MKKDIQNNDNFYLAPDYFSLLANRWQLKKKRKILEIGCGQGNWTKQLTTQLSKNTNVHLIDISAEYLNKAREFFSSYKHLNFSFYVGNVNSLPFEQNSFDFVTCHRVLMHIANPLHVLLEIRRVLRPGGLVAILEPYSLTRAISSSYRREINKLEHLGMLTKFQEITERGKQKLGRGNNSIGEEIPQLMQEARFQDISTSLNDKILQLLPILKSKQQDMFRNEIEQWLRERFYSIWEEDEAKDYFLAGGGTSDEFIKYRDFIRDLHDKLIKKVRSNKAHIILNDPTYISSGYKI